MDTDKSIDSCYWVTLFLYVVSSRYYKLLLTWLLVGKFSFVVLIPEIVTASVVVPVPAPVLAPASVSALALAPALAVALALAPAPAF